MLQFSLFLPLKHKPQWSLKHTHTLVLWVFCLRVCRCTICMPGAYGSQWSVSKAPGTEPINGCEPSGWVLGTELGFPAKESSTKPSLQRAQCNFLKVRRLNGLAFPPSWEHQSPGNFVISVLGNFGVYIWPLLIWQMFGQLVLLQLEQLQQRHKTMFLFFCDSHPYI